MKIDHVYIINLRATNENIVARLNQLGLPDGTGYTIVEAIDGKELLAHRLVLKSPYRVAQWWEIEGHENTWWSRPVNAAEVGCTLSHIKCWVEAMNAGHDNVLILEEDFNTAGQGWPTEEIENLPDDYDIFYLGRNKINNFPDRPFNDHLVCANYSYNTHAYMISKSGIKKAIDTRPHIDIIPADELLPGLMGVHPRTDVNERFGIAELKAYASNKLHPNYINQGAIMDSADTYQFEILNDSNWEAWCSKYITPVMLQKDFELMTEEIGHNIIEFPLFTSRFCEELIELAEAKGQWTMGRHEFYPTNDMLMQAIGMEDIYRRVVQEFVAPLATWYWTLEGRGWDTVEDETFIIRYKADMQGQLAVHHDYSSYTIGVKLNDEFEGGGTFFPKYQVNAMPKRNGNAFMHPGMITHRHGGLPVYSGTRYIAVSFIKNKEIMN